MKITSTTITESHLPIGRKKFGVERTLYIRKF